MIEKFRVTESARQMIESWLERPDFKGHVPTITWMADGKQRNWDWGVGTYLKSSLPAESRGFVRLDGMDFYVDPELHDRLEGKTLRFIDGVFRVT